MASCREEQGIQGFTNNIVPGLKDLGSSEYGGGQKGREGGRLWVIGIIDKLLKFRSIKVFEKKQGVSDREM